jgi:hypothetical protein
LATSNHYSKNGSRKKGYKVLALLVAIFLELCRTSPTFSQTENSYAVLLVEANGYMPFKDSYKINYETSTLGLPFEYSIGLLFPASSRLSIGGIVHYRSREAAFVGDMSVSNLEITPSIQYYLEEPVPKEIRIYGRTGVSFVRSNAQGVIRATTDGTTFNDKKVSRHYYNAGIAVGLGVMYPIGSLSGITAALDVRTYFGDPVSSGGLGNIGGVSVGIGYALGF